MKTWQKERQFISGEVVRLQRKVFKPHCRSEEDVHPSLLASCVRPRAERSEELGEQVRFSEELRMENNVLVP